MKEEAAQLTAQFAAAVSQLFSAPVASEQSEAVDEWIVDVVRQRGDVSLDLLLCALPSGAWSRLFLAVDRLSRAGKIAIHPPRNGDYLISLPAPDLGGMTAVGVNPERDKRDHDTPWR